MTANDLQKEIQKDLEALLADRRYETPAGEKAAVQVFRQFVPKRASEEDDDPFPYIEVRIAGGRLPNQESPEKVQVFLIIGIYDDDHENNGMESVMEIIHVIKVHYEETPLLAGKFVCDTEESPIEWDLQEEDSWPYFFGIMSLVFDIPAPRRVPVTNKKAQVLV